MKIIKLFIFYIVFTIIFPLPTHAFTRWEYDAIGVDNLIVNNTSNTIKIAVIDSGIINNDYLNPYISNGYNFINNNTDCTDTYGHGTKVSGILVDLARQTNLNIKLIPLKVVNENGTSTSDNIVKAINYAIIQKVDIINISLANENNIETVENAIRNAQTNNIIVISGSGNKSNANYSYPASYNNVLSIGSVNQNQEVSWFSNFNDKIDTTAPGEKVTTMELNGLYGLHSGTSLSTPFVTFEVALVKAYYPTLTNNQIIKVINETAIDKGDIGFDYHYGNGIVNYKNAIDNAYEALKEYTDWNTHSNVPLDKSWTISFNDSVQNIGKIVIMDEYYNIFPTDITVNDSKILIKPSKNYNENTIYSLIVSDVTSSSDKTIKNNVKMRFQTIGINKEIMSLKGINKEIPSLIPFVN